MDERLIRAEIRFLRGYAAVMTVVSAIFLLGVVSSRTHASFDTVDVKQLNVRDANGDLRLMLFGKDREPPGMFHGKPLCCRSGPKAAGLMFYNDEGDEVGGLIYGNDPDGGQGQSLTFDAYHQDQVVQLWQDGTLSSPSGGLIVNQVPSDPLWVTNAAVRKLLKMPHGAARTAEWNRLNDKGYFLRQRLTAGIDQNKVASVTLNDRQGRPRLRLAVDANGNPVIQFLSVDGTATRTISANSP